ncbi:hypothetical protein SAMN05421854_101533 [Amycolatopsis rubida]|uniref:Uncharacterized protein n=1 Tax=Amycolatopsis rubida TaxID=112413 RepID=A0A1I5E7K9_9PSEU|nr:hypothetical protein SAMN05421854_101533 [Amycolatopsis rubida]
MTAIARLPGNLALDHRRRTADALNPESLRGALAGPEAVVSALGSTGLGPTTVCSAGTAAIVSALPSGARLMVLSSAALATPPDAGPGARLLGGILRWVAAASVRRHGADGEAVGFQRARVDSGAAERVD